AHASPRGHCTARRAGTLPARLSGGQRRAAATGRGGHLQALQKCTQVTTVALRESAQRRARRPRRVAQYIHGCLHDRYLESAATLAQFVKRAYDALVILA